MVHGYTGWKHATSDHTHSSLGGPPPGPRSGPRPRRLLGVLVAAGVLVGAGVLVVVASDDDGRSGREVEERSQPPVVHEARLINDERLELDVSGPDGAVYCAESLTPVAGVGGDRRALCAADTIEGRWFSVDRLELDADELVGRELVVFAESEVEVPGSGAGPVVRSEPSEPVEIVDAR